MPPARARGVAVEAALLLLALLSVGLLAIRPLATQSARLRSERASARADLDAASARAALAAPAAKRIPDLEQRLARLEAIVPSPEQAADLSKAARSRAQAAGLRVLGDRTVASKPAGDLTRRRTDWVVEGSFGSLLEWLDWLESCGRLLSVGSVTVRRAGSDGSVHGEIGADVFHRPSGRLALAPEVPGP
jgi:hypothetical protein